MNSNGILEVYTPGPGGNITNQASYNDANGTAAVLNTAGGANSFAGHGVAVNEDGSLIAYTPSQNAGIGARTLRIVNPDGDVVYTIGQLDTAGDGTGALLNFPTDAAFFTQDGTPYLAVADRQSATSPAWGRIAIYDITPPVTTGTENFDDVSELNFDALVTTPASVTTTNTLWEVVNYVGLPSIEGPLAAAPGGNGIGLRTATNNDLPAVAAIAYQTFGNDTDSTYSVTAMMLPLYQQVSGSGTTWGGIGIRVNGPVAVGNVGDGYFAQVRVDNSGSFGSYINFQRSRNGVTSTIGRYYFVIGSNGIQVNNNGDGRAIRDPQLAAQNTWMELGLIAAGDSISLTIDGQLVTTYVDPDPVMTGKAMIFHEDPFNSQTVPYGHTGTIFDRVTVSDDVTLPVFLAPAPTDPAVIGAAPELGSWSDGSGQIMTEDNGVWEFTTSLANPSEWKIWTNVFAGWGSDIGRGGDGNNNMPGFATTGTITYYYDTRDLSGTGWEPELESLGATSASNVTWVAVGSFQADTPEGGAWNPDSSVTVLTDPENDGIFSYSFTASGGSTDAVWKAVSNTSPSWGGEVKFGTNRWSVDPGDSNNQNIPAYDAGDTVTLEFDAWRGRLRATVDPASSVSDWMLLTD